MYMPVIKEDKCSKCLECVRICPKSVFGTDKDEPTVEDPAHCTGCEACSAACPVKALQVKEL